MTVPHMRDVYINAVARYLPNDPVSNDQMEEYLGMIQGRPSRARAVVLRSNGIRQRYYALTKEGTASHTNAALTFHAIEQLLLRSGTDKTTIELLSCGTSTPDQLLPSHASMVHGLWKNAPMELNSAAGICTAGMTALKYGFLSVASGNARRAVCTGSERVSSWLRADKFQREEAASAEELKNNPVIAFEKDFLRWMLSDGAGAVLLENKPSEEGISVRICWVDGISYAHELEACMYAGALKEKGILVSWSDLPVSAWIENSVFAIKQDVRLLDAHIIRKGVESLQHMLRKHQLQAEELDYFLPHISSYYFKDRLSHAFEEAGIKIPQDKWFINLDKVGNVGAASIYLQIEALYTSGKLKSGDKILLSVPESGRFSYVYALLEVTG